MQKNTNIIVHCIRLFPTASKNILWNNHRTSLYWRTVTSEVSVRFTLMTEYLLIFIYLKVLHLHLEQNMLIEKSCVKIFRMGNYCGVDDLRSPLSLKTVLSTFHVQEFWIINQGCKEWISWSNIASGSFYHPQNAQSRWTFSFWGFFKGKIGALRPANI